jgi:hypothetical protein
MTSGSLRSIARLLKGRKILGGCDDCNAYQTIEEDPTYLGVFHINITHDDTCPWLARLEERKTT